MTNWLTKETFLPTSPILYGVPHRKSNASASGWWLIHHHNFSPWDLRLLCRYTHMEKEAEIYRAEQFRGSCTVMLQRVSTCPATGMQNDRSAELKRGLWRLNPLTAAVSSVLFIAAHQHNICNYQISPESSLPRWMGIVYFLASKTGGCKVSSIVFQGRS